MFTTGNDTVDKLALKVRTGIVGNALKNVTPINPAFPVEPKPLHNSNAAEKRVDVSDPSQKAMLRRAGGGLPFDFGVVNNGKPVESLTDFLNDEVTARRESGKQTGLLTDSTERLLGGGSENLKPGIKAQFAPKETPVSPAATYPAEFTPTPKNIESETGLNRPVNLPSISTLVGTRTIHKTKNVSFPLAVPVWRKQYAGQELQTQENGGLADATVGVGDYIFGFTIADKTAGTAINAVDIQEDIPFTVSGKQAFVKKATFDPATGKARLWVRLEENIPILIPLLIAGGAAVGFAGFGLSKTVDSVDKVVVDITGNAWKLAIALAIGVGAWYVIPYYFKRKGA